MTILQSLVALYDRLARRGETISTPGYAPVRIGFVLEIDADGTPLDLIDIRDHSERKPVAPWLMMPSVSRTSGIRPAFLWDKTAYVFGITGVEGLDDDGKRIVPGQGKRTLDEHQSFRLEHQQVLSENEDIGLAALRRFVEGWSPEQWVARGYPSDAIDQNIAFRLQGDRLRIDESEEARRLTAARVQAGSAIASCLVTGKEAPYAELQPQFKGVLGAQSSGASLVSFNAGAFESYGRKDGANAPVSEEAAFKYGAALNWLLDRANARRFRLGETTVVFWADERPDAGGEVAAAAAEDVLWAEFGSAADQDVDQEDAAVIATGLQNVKELRKAPDASKLQAETRIHILGLSPNSGRIAVRFWLVDTYGHLSQNLERHKRGMKLLPAPPNPDQKAYALLCEIAVQRDAKNIPPRLAGELARAILTGGHYPRTLLTAVVARIRSDKTVNPVRAALCKAIINREHDEEVVPVAIHTESDDGAYNLGRLFAAYEYAEKGVADRNATIRDKFIGSASATPRRVFPILMRGYEHNASALAKSEGNKRGAGVKAARTISQILDRFGAEMPFPTSLTLDEQGRFFVGYYHQMSALYTKSNVDAAAADATE